MHLSAVILDAHYPEIKVGDTWVMGTHTHTHTQALGDKVTKLIGVLVFKILLIQYKTEKQIRVLSEE